MSIRIRKEEYTTLADFILPVFVRDQAIFVARFPKFNDDFLTGFTTKLTFVKTLESGMVLTESQKAATKNLYIEADKLNFELNFLSGYIKDAGLNTSIVTDLKNNLFNHNIEGAVLQIEGLKQYVIAHKPALEAEGMSHDFPTELTSHKESLAAMNTIQNDIMRSHRELTDANNSHYEALYDFVAKIADKGKLLFKGTVTENEYSISKTLKKMRGGNGGGGTPPAPTS